MNNEPAFPCEEYDDYGTLVGFREGMQLRDYFAAKAMQGLLTHDQAANTQENIVAGWAYSIADAMLKIRNQSV